MSIWNATIRMKYCSCKSLVTERFLTGFRSDDWKRPHSVLFLSDHFKTPHALSSWKRPLPAQSETLYIDLHNPFLSDYKHGSKMPRQHNKAAGLGVEGGQVFPLICHLYVHVLRAIKRSHEYHYYVWEWVAEWSWRERSREREKKRKRRRDCVVLWWKAWLIREWWLQ